MTDLGRSRNDSSSEEESDEEIVLPKKRGFGFRVASTPEQAKQAVLNQIGSIASERQQNEQVVEGPKIVEKTQQELDALAARQKLIEDQNKAKAQQAAAIQAAAAARAPQVAGQQEAMEAQQRALQEAQKKAQEAQQKALQEAQQKAMEAQKKAQEAQQKALEEAQKKAREAQEAAMKKAQEAQKKAQEEAQKKVQEAQKKAQEEAQKRAQEAQKRAQEEAQKKAQEAQKRAQEEAQRKAQEAQRKAQQDAQKKAQEAQRKAQEEAQKRAQQQASQQRAPAAQVQKSQVQAQNQQKSQAQNQNQPKTPSAPNSVGSKTLPQTQKVPAQAVKGALAQSDVPQQEIHAAAAPKWTRTPGKVHAQEPVFDQPLPQKNLATGKALKQTAQAQESELAQPTPTSNTITVTAKRPAIQADAIAQKFVEKEQTEPQLDGPKTTGNQLEGAKRWMQEAQRKEEEMNRQFMEKGPAAVILQDDACWQTQKRVPVEIHQPQIGKIEIPELTEKEVQKTIVAQPASYQKVKWNEFPEEHKPELGAAPRTKTQEWNPVNQEQTEVQRNGYKPARISAVWPPVQDERNYEGHQPVVIKPTDDTAWLMEQQSNPVQTNAVWTKTSRINRVWPPPEAESDNQNYSGPQHMPVVQWPPPEAEQHEREQVELLQKHIPTKKIERQWPPPPPQYHVIEQTTTIINPNEITPDQQCQNSATLVA